MRTLLIFSLLAILLPGGANAREWFVRQADPNASDTGDGSTNHPLRTINAAAQLAQPGDIVTVGPGIYREWISPAHGGSDKAPITYRAIPEHGAIVRGTDLVSTNWQPETDAPGVFTAPLPQSAFVFGNPFVHPPQPSDKKLLTKCNALVFHNDHLLSQALSHDHLLHTPNTWLSSEDGQRLLIHLADNSAPAPGTVEVTTRDRIFAPHRRGLGYIHVEGFIFERCATRPDWPQLGALSARSGHDWIIRNNIVRQTTGKGIDCGSETWDPASLTATEPEDKHILIAGHNLVESNLVTDNAQCGIAAWNTDFVKIIGNIVRENGSSASADKRSLTDFEAAGIKVHAFRDGLIEGNLVISNSSFGIWLDNGWERARVTRNVAIANCGSGIFFELAFGPALIDHNLCAANRLLGKPYFGDGIYTHDASGVTITHNTLLDNAHDGIQQIIVSERVYWPKRLAEASSETITGNLFFGNHNAAISLPLTSPRSHDNTSDHNAFGADEKFTINANNGRIPVEMILREARDRVQAADLSPTIRPDLSNPKHLPNLTVPAWQAIMLMDQSSTTLPSNVHISFDQQSLALTIDLSTNALPTVPSSNTDDTDLLGHHTKSGTGQPGAIQNLQPGSQTFKVWPL